MFLHFYSISSYFITKYISFLYSINIIYTFCTSGFYFTILGCEDMELWSHPWWVLGLTSLTILLILLFAMFIASCIAFGRKSGLCTNGGVSQPYHDPFSKSYITPVQALSRTTSLNKNGYSVNAWATRTFIAIILLCVALFLLSQLPGFQSPFWLGIVLQGYTYCSAALFFASVRGDPTGY